jgi:hypothetical protein
MTHNERQELNTLSRECFGVSSRWQKLVNSGVLEPYERERDVMVPRANGEIVKKTFKDKKSVVRHYTVEEVKSLMVYLIAQRRGNPISAPVQSTPSAQEIALSPEGTATLADGSTLTVTTTE